MDSDVEDFIVSGLAKRLCGQYEVPVSAQLAGEVKEATSELYRRYNRIEPMRFPSTLPSWTNDYTGGYDADRNGVDTTRTVTNVSADYTLLLTDDLVLVDCSNGPVTITLMSASSGDGYGFEIQKVDQTSNQVILVADRDWETRTRSSVSSSV